MVSIHFAGIPHGLGMCVWVKVSDENEKRACVTTRVRARPDQLLQTKIPNNKIIVCSFDHVPVRVYVCVRILHQNTDQQ